MMLPSPEDPVWNGLSPQTRSDLQRRLRLDKAQMDRMVGYHYERASKNGRCLILASAPETLNRRIAELHHVAALDRLIAYAPTMLAFAVAVWTWIAFGYVDHDYAYTAIFLMFTVFGLISVRIQGKHRPGVSNPDTINRILDLARQRVLVTPDGIAYYDGQSEANCYRWIPRSTLTSVIIKDTGITLKDERETYEWPISECRGYDKGHPLKEKVTVIALQKMIGDAFERKNEDPERIQILDKPQEYALAA